MDKRAAAAAAAGILTGASLALGLATAGHPHTYRADGTAAVVAWQCGPGVELVRQPTVVWAGAYVEQCK